MAFLPTLYLVVVFVTPLFYFLLNDKTRKYFVSVLAKYGFIGRLAYSLLLLIAFLLARFLLFEFLFVIKKGLIDFYALGDLQISLIIIFAELSLSNNFQVKSTKFSVVSIQTLFFSLFLSSSVINP